MGRNKCQYKIIYLFTYLIGHSPGLNVTVPLNSPRRVGSTSNLYDSFLFCRIINLSGPFINGELDDAFILNVIYILLIDLF